MAKITGENVTDEQIRELRRELKKRRLRSKSENAMIATCTIALTDRRAMAFMIVGVREGVQSARDRCAAILNARAEGKQP